MKLEKFKPLYLDTINKEYRSKTLIFLFVITLALIFLINAGMDFILEMVKEQDILNLASRKAGVFLFVISSWTSILSIFFGVGCINSDVEKGIINQFLSFPISRFNYLLARVTGTFSIVFAYYILSVILAFIIFSFGDHPLNIGWGYIFALFNIGIVILGLITLSAFISLYFSRLLGFIISLVLTVIIYASNKALFQMKFADQFTDISIFKAFGLLIHYLFPRIGVFSSFTNDALLGDDTGGSYWPHLVQFGLTYCLLLFVFYFFFKRKES